MIINEQEKKDILSKYQDDTSNELLTYLKRHYPVSVINSDWMIDSGIDPIKMIFVDEKQYVLSGNKKYLVSKIDSDLGDDWTGTPEKIRRRTIKKYLDGMSI
jgi:hypothetical protein